MNYKLEPFDIEKAKAGAKIVTKRGLDFTVLSYDGRINGYPILGYIGDSNSLTAFSKDGSCSIGPSGKELRLSTPCFPDPPEGEEWHNPHNLTPEQVGDGYRLLLKSEIKYRGIKVDFIDGWDDDTWDTAPVWSGSDDNYTYRIPADTPFHWDKELEPKYKPFDSETIQSVLGSAVKSKHGNHGGIIIAYDETCVLAGGVVRTYECLLLDFVMMDGSPCGVPV